MGRIRRAFKDKTRLFPRKNFWTPFSSSVFYNMCIMFVGLCVCVCVSVTSFRYTRARYKKLCTKQLPSMLMMSYHHGIWRFTREITLHQFPFRTFISVLPFNLSICVTIPPPLILIDYLCTWHFEFSKSPQVHSLAEGSVAIMYVKNY